MTPCLCGIYWSAHQGPEPRTGPHGCSGDVGLPDSGPYMCTKRTVCPLAVAQLKETTGGKQKNFPFLLFYFPVYSFLLSFFLSNFRPLYQMPKTM